MPESNTPVSTPSERSCVATTTTTVATITTDEAGGWRRRFGIEFQLNVPIETIIITATSAGMGILPTHGPSTVSRNSRSDAHTSELQSLMRISYAVLCLKKKTNQHQ